MKKKCKLCSDQEECDDCFILRVGMKTDIEQAKKDYRIGYQKGAQLKLMAPGVLEWRVAEAKRLIREGYSKRWSPSASGLSIEYLQGFLDGAKGSND